MTEIKENAPVFVGVAVIYSYIQSKAEQEGGEKEENSTRLVFGEELTQEEKEGLPQDLKEIIHGLGGARCFQVLVKKG